jgi:hypothetical protein
MALDIPELAGLCNMHVVMDRSAAAGIRRIAALIGGSWTNHQWRFRRQQWRLRQRGGWIVGGLWRKKGGVFGSDHWSKGRGIVVQRLLAIRLQGVGRRVAIAAGKVDN